MYTKKSTYFHHSRAISKKFNYFLFIGSGPYSVMYDLALSALYWVYSHLIVAAAFAVVALAIPRALGPLSRAWQGLGKAIHKVVNPVVMGLLFYLTVTPTGLLMRLFGKDPLRLRFDPEAKSYWIERRPPGPAPETMHQQF